jgi:hypothetical protein
MVAVHTEGKQFFASKESFDLLEKVARSTGGHALAGYELPEGWLRVGRGCCDRGLAATTASSSPANLLISVRGSVIRLYPLRPRKLAACWNRKQLGLDGYGMQTFCDSPDLIEGAERRATQVDPWVFAEFLQLGSMFHEHDAGKSASVLAAAYGASPASPPSAAIANRALSSCDEMAGSSILNCSSVTLRKSVAVAP